MRQITLQGTPRDMGLQYGRELAVDIRALAEERLRLTLKDMESNGLEPSETACFALARRMLRIQADWHSDVHAEFMGIAEGAKVDPELLLIGNGYTDFRDVVSQTDASYLSECTSFLVGPPTADGPYLGQTWDMHNSAQPFVIVVRREPTDSPRTLSLTTTGCLSLIGVNEYGIGIGNNNLVPTDAEVGVIYLAMIHAALSCRTFREAWDVITSAPRASGHHYLLTDSENRQAGIETTARQHTVFQPYEGQYVHANHYLDAALPAKEGIANSTLRQEILMENLKVNTDYLSIDHLKTALSDRTGAPDCVCRYGDEQVSGRKAGSGFARTCAAAIIDPKARGMWVTDGPPDQNEWQWISL